MAEFEWINKQGVRSTRGFAVQRTGRYTLEYREGPHKTVFLCNSGVDPETNKSALLIQVYPFPAWGGLSTEARRHEIVGNLGRATLFRGLIPHFITDSGEEFRMSWPTARPLGFTGLDEHRESGENG